VSDFMDPLWREVEVARDGIDSFAGDGREMEAFERLVVDRARLRRIEEAARELGGIWDAIDATKDNDSAPGVPWNVVEASLDALRAALDQEVKG